MVFKHLLFALIKNVVAYMKAHNILQLFTIQQLIVYLKLFVKYVLLIY